MKLRIFRNRKWRGASGVVAVELALAFPLVACIVFTGFEFSRTVLASQSLAMLSNEGAGRTFRECAFISGSAQTTCVGQVATQLTQFANANLPGADVVVSVYSSDGAGTVTRTAIGGVNPVTQQSPHGYTSRLDAAAVRTKYPFLNSDKSKLAVGEVFFRQDSISPSISWIFKLGSRDLYDVTVY